MPNDADRPASSAAMRWAQERGIQLCRQGHWEAGLALLRRAVRADPTGEWLPSLVYSYLGRGLARVENKPLDGLALCRHALECDAAEPENHVNLARILLEAGRKRGAVEALGLGLAAAPEDPLLRRLRDELGIRKRPPLPLWPRRHPLNRSLGRLRHRLLG